MAFTDLQTVRKHLISSKIPEQEVREHPVYLSGTNEVELPHGNLVESSETVKWVNRIHPEQDGSIQLITEKWAAINATFLIPGTVVVVTDDDLATVYVEEKDYVIDHQEGLIRRVASGDIPNLQQVFVHFERFDVFEQTTDYTMDYEDGKITRTAGSGIPSGTTVLVDYTVAEGSLEDAMIEQAITEAEDIVLRSLSSEYDESSDDQGLTTGATQLSLSIFARSMAAETLVANRSSDAHSRSREWQSLAAQLEAQAWQTLGSFLDPNKLNSPVVQ